MVLYRRALRQWRILRPEKASFQAARTPTRIFNNELDALASFSFSPSLLPSPPFSLSLSFAWNIFISRRRVLLPFLLLISPPLSPSPTPTIIATSISIVDRAMTRISNEMRHGRCVADLTSWSSRLWEKEPRLASESDINLESAEGNDNWWLLVNHRHSPVCFSLH